MYQEARENARLEVKISYAEAKFNEVFPYVEQAILDQQGPGPAVRTPGFLTKLPVITVDGSVGVDLLVSAAQTRVNQRIILENTKAGASLKSRGFATTIPLASRLATLYQQQGSIITFGVDSSAHLAASQVASDLTIKQQQARLELFDGQQEALIASEANQVHRVVGLTEAVARMVAGLAG